MRGEVINYEVSNYAQGWYSYILYLVKIIPGVGKVGISAQSHHPGQKSKSVSQAVSLSQYTQTHTHTHVHTHTHIHTCAHTHRRAGRGSHSAQVRAQKPPRLQSSVSAGVSPALQHRPRHPCQVQQLTGLVTGSKRPQAGPDSGPIRCRDAQESRSGS